MEQHPVIIVENGLAGGPSAERLLPVLLPDID